MADFTLMAKILADASNFISGVRQAKSSAEDLGSSTKGLGSKLQLAGSGMEVFGGKVTNAGGVMVSTGAKITAATAPLTLFGLSSIKTGMSFQAGMSEVQAISGATGKDMAQLEEVAKRMGATTKFSATEASEGLKYMAMAGWNAGQMTSGLPGILNLAAASGEALGTTSDIVTDALTAFGLQAEDSAHFADVLAVTSSSANTNVSLLGESFKYVAPLAGAMKYKAEDVSKALGLMANAGIKGSQAGNHLKNMITNLTKPTDEMAEVMNKLGISMNNQDGSMKTLDELMKNLRSSFSGLTEQQQAQAAATLFGKESMSGALAVINASQSDYDKLSNAIANSNGKAKEMADIMQNNLAGKITTLKSGLEGFQIALFDTVKGPLMALADKAQLVMDKFNGLEASTKGNIAVFIAVAAAIGPTLVALGTGTMIVGKSFSSLGSAVSGVGKVFTLLSSPIGLVAVAVLALVGIFAYFMTTNKEFRESVLSIGKSLLNSLVPVFQTISTTIREVASKVLPQLMSAFKQLLPTFISVGSLLASTIVSLIPTFQLLFQAIGKIVQMVLPVLVDLFTALAPVIMQVVAMVVQLVASLVPLIAQFITALLPVIVNIISAFVNLTQAVLPIFISIVQVVIAVVQAIIPVFLAVASAVVENVSTIITVIGTIIGVVINVMATIMSVISPIIAFISMVITSIVAVIGGIIGVVSNIFSTVYSIIQGTFRAGLNIISSVISSITGVVNRLTGVFSGVFYGISSIVNSTMSAVNSVILGVFNGLRSAWSGLTGFVGGVFSGIGNSVSSLVGQVKGFVNGVIGGINAAIGLINKIPGVSIGAIPYLYHGTNDWGGGFARMNEGGRGEMVLLPSGSQVISHDVSMAYARESARQSRYGANIELNPTSANDRQVVSLLKELLRKDSHVYMDSKEVGVLTAKPAQDEASKWAYIRNRAGGFA